MPHCLGCFSRVGPANPNALQFSEPGRTLCLIFWQEAQPARESGLAYSLNDVYRFLRVVMRIDGVVVGLGLGLLLTVSPQSALAEWGVHTAGPVWPVRMAGGLLLTLGVLLLLSAQERIVGGPSMVAMSLGNSVVALVLLAAYLQHELAMLNLFGQLLLIAVFVTCLIGAVFPLHYVRAEYRAA